jgi:tRNA threonylcarbamoyl adenosine modification protein YeaZ
LLLSIDTTAGTSVAVFEGQHELSFIDNADPFGHAENIGDCLTEALASAGKRIAEVTEVLVGRGPASYTGLRVGIAAAKTIAASLGVPLRGVMVLDALAYQQPGKVLVTSDAKRRELFAATYENGLRLDGPFLTTSEQLGQFQDFRHLAGASDARLNAKFFASTSQNLSDSSPIYLRSPDVTPSKGKKVSG